MLIIRSNFRILSRDEKPDRDVMLSADIFQLGGIIEVFVDTELAINRDIDAYFVLCNSMDCVDKPFVLAESASWNKPFAFSWLICPFTQNDSFTMLYDKIY